MTSPPTGSVRDRLLRLVHEAARRCTLDLHGLTVLTEAASGAYAVTPLLAAVAGARVLAVTRSSGYGTAQEIERETMTLARLAGVGDLVRVFDGNGRDLVGQADIITNSGHVRPIDAALLTSAKRTVVVPLMYEAWEFRDADVDLAACAARSVPVAGTNERHPSVDVFSYLGVMAIKLLADAGVAVYRSRVLLLSDNDFGPFIARTLQAVGCTVETARASAEASGEPRDALLVALTPASAPVLGAEDSRVVAERWPGAVVAQFWGDVDRTALGEAGVEFWPLQAPKPGHMAILPSAIGPEPIVRLQAGGLKVGEILSRARIGGASLEEALQAAEQSGFATLLPAGRRHLA